jgi:TIR domain
MEQNLKYQVVIIDTTANGNASALEATVRGRVADLNVPDDALRFLSPANISELNAKAPKVGVFFGGGPITDRAERAIELLLGLATVVVPVVPSLRQFTSEVPPVLHSINGMELDPADSQLEQLAALVLECLYLVRKRRRIFISYKRDESRNAAVQLYHELDKRSFDVFLDTHSVRQGDLFQEALWHRMVDSDVVVLLHTKGALSSRWVDEEIARANSMGITVLQLVWPDNSRAGTTHLFEPLYLSESDFKSFDPLADGGGELTPPALSTVAINTERLRARSLASRETFLVNRLCDLARGAGIQTAVQRVRCVDVFSKKRGKIRVFLGVGVPDAVSFQQSVWEDGGTPPVETKLMYDPRSIAPSWVSHLDWLHKYLPVKTIKTTEVREWLQTL